MLIEIRTRRNLVDSREYYVYGLTRDSRTCPSLGMALADWSAKSSFTSAKGEK